MPVTEQVQDAIKGGNRNTALAAAAAAAAGGAATYAVRRALASDGKSESESRGNGSSGNSRSSGASSILSSAATSGWDAASGVLIPMLEEAAESAGKYVAEHGPDIVRDRIVPRFIEAFNEAR